MFLEGEPEAYRDKPGGDVLVCQEIHGSDMKLKCHTCAIWCAICGHNSPSLLGMVFFRKFENYNSHS